MTGPVVSFDLNGSRRRTQAAADTRDARAMEQTLAGAFDDRATANDAGTTEPAPRSAPAGPVSARAELGATFAAQIGADLAASDLQEQLTLLGVDKVTLADMARAFEAAGLNTRLRRVNRPDPRLWPALARMTGGHIVLVLAQDDQSVTLYDTTCPDNRADVPLDEFTPHFEGEVLSAGLTPQMLAQKHKATDAKGHWFWSHMARFRRHFAEIALGSLVANLLAVAVALFSLQIYDRVIPHQSQATLWVLAIGAGLAIVLEAGLKIARAQIMDGAGRRMELQVQSLLMSRLLGMKRGDPSRSPSLMFSAVRDFGSIREFFTASTIGSLTDLPFILLFLALVWSIGGPVVWVLIAGGVLMVLPSLLMQKRMVALTQKSQGAAMRSNKLLHEVIYDTDTIKTHRGEARFARTWDELTALSALVTSEQRKLGASLTFWAQGVQQATYVAAVVMGTYLVFAGEFTVGTIIAVGILTGRTLGPLTQLAGTLSRWSNVKGALEALDKVALAPQDHEEGRSYLRRDSLSGAFELRELGFDYDSDAGHTLDIPALAIKPGQKLAILGANGSGKSTLLRVLSGLYTPTRGRVLLDGVDMSQIMPRDLRRSIGYLSQEVRLFSGTLRDNLNLTGFERDDDRLLQALDFAGLGPFVRHHAKGLDLEIRDGGEGLSIGQRQSIGWARLWLQDPQICLLDEPTAALDQTLEATLVSRLESWLQGRTAIIATHRVPILHLTERTLILQNGRMAVDGPRDQVLEHLKNRRAG